MQKNEAIYPQTQSDRASIPSFIYYSLSVYKAPEIVLGAGDTELYKTDIVAALPGHWNSEGNV